MQHMHLDDLICPGSSVAIAINSLRKLSWTKDPKAVAVIISVNVHGHKDGKPFTWMPQLGSSIAEGVTKYIVTMRNTILAQFIGASITEIK